MNSIRRQITRLAIIAVVIAVVIASVISVISFRLQENVGSERLMSLICETSGERINERLEAIEQSVNSVASYIAGSLDAVELVKGEVVGATGSGVSLKGHDFESGSQQNFDAYLSAHVDDVQAVFSSLAAQNEGVLSYYYRINPEISSKEEGFLYSRIGGGDYAPTKPTDINAYQSNDYASVGWYYLPQESGRPVWISPYYDANQKVEVVSFIAPVYKAGTFIGVTGMDIAYDTLVDQIRDLDVLSTGYAFLTDAHSSIVYHPTLPRQTSLGDVYSELETSEMGVGDLSIVAYSTEGVEKRAAWTTLRNDMRLFVCAPTSEINASWYVPTVLVLASFAIVVVLLIAIVAIGARRITRPLEELTAAATQLSEGNYDFDLTYDGNDEVGILTSSFRHLVDTLKVRIAFLYDRAYKDALTGVKNKAAYDAYAAEIDEGLAQGSTLGFAVVACDCNELKRVNDTFGHDRGDAYLTGSCRVICHIYDHSPVFRTGGDEFICILTGEDYEKREQLEREFWALMKREAEKPGPDWDKVSLAMGMAVFDPSTDRSVMDVARRADDLMYRNKNEFKARRSRGTRLS